MIRFYFWSFSHRIWSGFCYKSKNSFLPIVWNLFYREGAYIYISELNKTKGMRSQKEGYELLRGQLTSLHYPKTSYFFYVVWSCLDDYSNLPSPLRSHLRFLKDILQTIGKKRQGDFFLRVFVCFLLFILKENETLKYFLFGRFNESLIQRSNVLKW